MSSWAGMSPVVIALCHRYERIKVAYEGLTQGVGENVSLDQLTKVRCLM